MESQAPVEYVAPQVVDVITAGTPLPRATSDHQDAFDVGRLENSNEVSRV